MRFRDGYNGSSFMELLQTEFPHLAPRWDRLFAAAGELPALAHGTTVIGSRASEARDLHGPSYSRACRKSVSASSENTTTKRSGWAFPPFPDSES